METVGTGALPTRPRPPRFAFKVGAAQGFSRMLQTGADQHDRASVHAFVKHLEHAPFPPADALNAVDEDHSTHRVTRASNVGKIVVEHPQFVRPTGEVQRPVAIAAALVG